MTRISRNRLSALAFAMAVVCTGMTNSASAAPGVVLDRYFDLDQREGCEHAWAYLGRTSDRFCTLNAVMGHLAGYGEYGDVYRSGPYWYFRGNSCQRDVGFRVTCVD